LARSSRSFPEKVFVDDDSVVTRVRDYVSVGASDPGVGPIDAERLFPRRTRAFQTLPVRWGGSGYWSAILLGGDDMPPAAENIPLA